MSTIDVAVIVVYVVGCTALGVRLGSGAGGLRGYFLGESDIPAWAVMISIVATETSAVTFLSVPGIAYKGDMRFLQLAIGYILARVVVARVLLPSYFKGEIYTAYEILNDRFGGASRTAASLLFLTTRTLGAGLRLFLAAKVLQLITGMGMPASIGLIGGSTVLYTYLGGIKAVVWTDVLQFAIYLLGAAVALVILVRLIPGGLGEIVERGRLAHKFRIFDLSWSWADPYTFWAGVIGGLVLDTGTHGVDQIMVQRYLTARSERQAAWAVVGSGFLVFAQFALFLFIGVGLYVLAQVAPSGPPPNADEEFATFIIRYMPTGVLGLIIAAVFSVTMSSLSGSLSASASSTMNDLYLPLRPRSKEGHLLRVSKGLTLFWGVVQAGVAFLAWRVGLSGPVVGYALAVASFVTGILLGLFLLGILTVRVGQEAAFAGMVAGVAVVVSVWWNTPLAWPWYGLVGSATVYGVGLAASLFWPRIESTRLKTIDLDGKVRTR